MKLFYLSVLCAFLVSVQEGNSIKLLGRLRDLIHGTTSTTELPEYEKENGYGTASWSNENSDSSESASSENSGPGSYPSTKGSKKSPTAVPSTLNSGQSLDHSQPGFQESSTLNYGSYPGYRETTENGSLFEMSTERTTRRYSIQDNQDSHSTQTSDSGLNSQYPPQTSDNYDQKQSSSGYKPGLGTYQQSSFDNDQQQENELQQSGSNNNKPQTEYHNQQQNSDDNYQQYSSNNNDKQQSNGEQQSIDSSKPQPSLPVESLDGAPIVFPDSDYNETTTNTQPVYVSESQSSYGDGSTSQRKYTTEGSYVPYSTGGQYTTEGSYVPYSTGRQYTTEGSYVPYSTGGQYATEGSYVPYSTGRQYTTESSYVPDVFDGDSYIPGVKSSFKSQGTTEVPNSAYVPYLVDSNTDNALFLSTTTTPTKHVPVPDDSGKTVINAPDKECEVGKKLEGGKCRKIARK